MKNSYLTHWQKASPSQTGWAQPLKAQLACGSGFRGVWNRPQPRISRLGPGRSHPARLANPPQEAKPFHPRYLPKTQGRASHSSTARVKSDFFRLWALSWGKAKQTADLALQAPLSPPYSVPGTRPGMSLLHYRNVGSKLQEPTRSRLIAFTPIPSEGRRSRTKAPFFPRRGCCVRLLISLQGRAKLAWGQPATKSSRFSKP